MYQRGTLASQVRSGASGRIVGAEGTNGNEGLYSLPSFERNMANAKSATFVAFLIASW
jgi:hypothetical protein